MIKKCLMPLLIMIVFIGATQVASQAADAKKDKKKVDGKSAASPLPIFNGKDFRGWKFVLQDENIDPSTVWSIKRKVILCNGSATGYLRTEKEFTNYKLTFEWRWPKGAGNSGLLFHMTGEDKIWPQGYEAQLQHENAGDIHVIDTTFTERGDRIASDHRTPKKEPSSEKPLARWNKMELICDKDTVKVLVNDVLQNEFTGASVRKGYIGFQSEGAPIELRKIQLWPVPKNKEKQEEK